MGFINKKLIYENQGFNSQKELFEFMFYKLSKEGYVEKTYLNAIIEREENYPTGFQIGNIGIAIPHVDSKHVKKNGLFFTTLENNLKFEDAEEDQMLDVSIIFGLIIKDHDDHINMLVKLTDLFQKDGFLQELKDKKNVEDLFNMLSSQI